MKLFRFGEPGHERPGVVLDGRRVDVSGWSAEWPGGADYGEAFFAEGGVERLGQWLQVHGSECPEVPDAARWAPPVARPSKIVAIGLNYRAHAEETGARLPTEPKIFMKASSAWSGPFDPLVLPRGSRKTDYEVELAVIVGRAASYVTRDEAPAYIAGYAVFNDYSERDFQKEREGQWVKGKSADSFAPCGPYLVTADAIDPSDLRIWLSVNGEIRQDSRTRDLVFDVPYLVSYLSQFMTLLPGDVISTGTPSGVGLGRTPPEFLRPNDVVEFGIEGLGQARQLVVERAP